MIKKLLTYYTQLLEEFLQNDFPQPEGVVENRFVGNGIVDETAALGTDTYPSVTDSISACGI